MDGFRRYAHARVITDFKNIADYQPRTQAQITKNRHTTVLLYRSVAKLSERAGVLGEDAAKEAPGRICIKHGGRLIHIHKCK